MRIKTFRFRIALLSVVCSSLVLVVTALVVANIIWRIEVARADSFTTGIVKQYIDRDSMPPPAYDGFRPDREGLRSRGPDRGRGPDGNRRGFGRGRDGPGSGGPAWQRMRAVMNDGASSAPLTFYVFRDLGEMRERRSDYWPKSLSEKELHIPADSTVEPKTIRKDGRLWRIATGGTIERIAVVGVDLEPAVSSVKQVATAFMLSIPAALLLIALGAVFMARRALRPVEELTRLVERITASGLGERIKSPARDAEFEKLIIVFNQMMDRLERSFLQANRFSADAAHELRTPVSILQGYVEQMLQLADPGSNIQRNLGEMVDEIHRIKSILEKLLLLARMDAGQVQIKTAPADLSGIVEGVVEDVQAVAAHITVESRIEPGICVNADEALLETAIQNLGSNAAKYNREHDGRIEIELVRKDEDAVLTVSNTGPKIREEDAEKIFDRFYRADKARSREVDGLGLGLSLARDIVQAHHGKLELGEAGDGINRFVMTLPLAAAPRKRTPATIDG